LVNCIYKFKQKQISKKILAEIACEIEINNCKKLIGMQDQYNASYGGFNEFKFYYNKEVKKFKVNISQKRLQEFKDKLLLFYTGINRQTSKILSVSNFHERLEINKVLKELVINFKYELVNGDLKNLGKILHENWILKKKTSKKISNLYFDSIYSTAIKAGASGGKLLGAGGGGFFLFIAEPHLHQEIKNKLNPLKHINFDFTNNGSQILIN
jgi:D-glycero-alpha-D-manno-heptose-7-phosphate kinase